MSAWVRRRPSSTFQTTVAFISSRWVSSRSPRSAAYMCALIVRNTSRAPARSGNASSVRHPRVSNVVRAASTTAGMRGSNGIEPPAAGAHATLRSLRSSPRRRERRRGVGQRDRHPRIRTRQRREQQGRVLDSASHRPVHRQVLPRVRRRPRRHPPRRRPEADHVAEAGRVAQRTTEIAAVGDGHHAAREGDGSPTGGAAARLRAVVGFRVGPKTGLNVCDPAPNSGVFVLPTTIAPAARARSTSRSSVSGTASAKIGEPAVVRIPAVATRSLCAIGRPCSGPTGSLLERRCRRRAEPHPRHDRPRADDRVHRGVHRVDPLEVGGDHLTSRELSCPQPPRRSVAGRKHSSLAEVTGARLSRHRSHRGRVALVRERAGRADDDVEN